MKEGDAVVANKESKKRISCLFQLQSVIEYLNPAERRVAEYIIKNPREILTLTINELAEQTGASYATVTRLIKRVGLSGYKELKNNLYHDVLNTDDLDVLDIINLSQESSVEAICESSFDLAIRTLEDCYKILDAEAIQNIVNCLIGAETIMFVGAGASGISARYAYSKFFRVGMRVIYEADATLFRMHSSLLKKGDVLFAISSSGRTKEIVECAKLARERGATVISMSDYAASPLSRCSDHSLYTTPRSTNTFLGIDLPLTVSQITLIDTVYISTCVKMGKISSEIYNKTKTSADSEKIK